MRARLVSVHSPDIDIEAFKPEDPLCFGFLLELKIGPESGPGADLFHLTVCTPGWLENQYAEDGMVFSRHRLIVFDFNMPRIIQRITKLIQAHDANTWEELATKLGRYVQWEFEDYRPHES